MKPETKQTDNKPPTKLRNLYVTTRTKHKPLKRKVEVYDEYKQLLTTLKRDPSILI